MCTYMEYRKTLQLVFRSSPHILPELQTVLEAIYAGVIQGWLIKVPERHNKEYEPYLFKVLVQQPPPLFRQVTIM